jgi:SAM-dependent methyltransferase
LTKETATRSLEALHTEIREEHETDTSADVFDAVLSRLRPEFGDSPRLLDFGAGAAPCFPIARRYGFDYTGVEFDPSAQREALVKHNTTLHPDLENLPSGHYDLAIMVEVIEHLQNPLSALTSLRTHLRPGGLLYLSTPNAECLKARLQGLRWPNYGESHLFFFTDASLAVLLGEAGFTEVDQQRFFIRFGSHSLPRQVLQRLLLATGQDGGLRFLARA